MYIKEVSRQILNSLTRHSRHSQECLCVVEGQCLGRVTQPDLEPLVILPKRYQQRHEDDNAQGGCHQGQRLPVWQLRRSCWWRVGLLRWRRRQWHNVVPAGPLGALGSGQKNVRIHRNTPAKRCQKTTCAPSYLCTLRGRNSFLKISTCLFLLQITFYFQNIVKL